MQDLLLKLADHAIEAVGFVLLSLASIGVSRFSTWLKTKTQIELSDADQAHLRLIAEDAIHYAKEVAHQKAQQGVQLVGEEKLNHAIDYVYMQTAGPLNKEEVRQRIHSALGKKR